MKSQLTNLTYEIEIMPGEKLTLPDFLINSVGAGRWVISIQPSAEEKTTAAIRNHDAFLNGYEPEDEGLYDDYPSR